MRIALRTALIMFGLLLATAASAAASTPVGTSPVGTSPVGTSPVGIWTQVDDATGKPKSIIEITRLSDGTLQGVVKRVLFSDQGPQPVCGKCDGTRHNKPVVGMVILWGVKKDGKVWDGGKVLDPHNGKTYKVKLSMGDDGQKLDVRGYLGMPLFGRTQTWLRKSD